MENSSRSASLIHAFISARTGMALSGSQRRRLDERLAALQGNLSEQQFLMYLQSPAGVAELAALISVVAVHKTDLFRDEVQLSSFRSHVLEPLVAQGQGRPLRVWSAGCATGEEVATLLILLEEAGADPSSTVLGTDISDAVLTRARSLSFAADQVRRLPQGIRERYFVPDGTRSALLPQLRERASFQIHNLMDMPYPVGGGDGFDVIFCRNVLIYFTAEAFDRVVESLAERLTMGGTLVLSSAEPLLHAPPSLRIIRGEHAFFYVRTQDLMAAQLKRKPGDPLPLPTDRRRDAGSFPVIGPSAPGDAPRDLGAVPSGGESRRESGRFVVVPPPTPRDSGRFPAVPASQPQRESGRFPAVPASQPQRESGRFPAVPPAPALVGRPESGQFPTVGLAEGADAREQGPQDPVHAEADGLFAQVLDGVGETDARTEEYLRRCLTLDPDLAAARYLLAMLLELREAFAEAAAEYRKALRSLEEGRARPTPFFLNHARLRVACARAVERMEDGSRPR
ncbi:CheR family methyltransferase [Hyalangium rubrum]|uniref:CheR family methyltransferase n=1 Tax=Hyalangium rubrum TaxID=3103134 RepID=A0ABU5HB85_9BACT|nr:CheR family methyltransferase [Hyalangium sp. s54d21]MDY7230550.1 CheR family methyltransferase [Hyalangium sp. s54d21]